MFAYRRQPLKTFYIVFGAFSVLLRLPLWAIRYLFPSMRPRRSWSMSRSLIIKLLDEGTAIVLQIGLPVTPPLETMALSADKNGFVWVQPRPDLVVGDIQHFADFNKVQAVKTAGFWFGERDSDGRVGGKARTDEKVVLNLHGGGFVLGSGGPSFTPSATICKGILEHVPQVKRVFSMEYRLAAGPPYTINNPFPAALIDIIAGYRYLLDLGFIPHNIIVAGDSCGGILAYQLLRYQTMYKLPELPIAGALLLFSPSADSALRADPGTSMVSNAPSDVARSWLQANYGAIALLGHLPASELDKSWLSPGSLAFSDAEIKGVFLDFPPTFILAGEAEMSRDSMRILCDRMRLDMGNSKVTYVEIENAPHDFVSLGFVEPERSSGLKEVGKWASQLF